MVSRPRAWGDRMLLLQRLWASLQVTPPSCAVTRPPGVHPCCSSPCRPAAAGRRLTGGRQQHERHGGECRRPGHSFLDQQKLCEAGEAARRALERQPGDGAALVGGVGAAPDSPNSDVLPTVGVVTWLRSGIRDVESRWGAAPCVGTGALDAARGLLHRILMASDDVGCGRRGVGGALHAPAGGAASLARCGCVLTRWHAHIAWHGVATRAHNLSWQAC